MGTLRFYISNFFSCLCLYCKLFFSTGLLSLDYHTSHFWGGFMGTPTGHPKACANSREFWIDPLARHFQGGCALPRINCIKYSGLSLLHQTRPNEMKKSWSGVYFSKPGNLKFLYLCVWRMDKQNARKGVSAYLFCVCSATYVQTNNKQKKKRGKGNLRDP